MGPVKQIEETLNSIQPEVPIEKTTSPSEIMSLGWAVVSLIIGPLCGYYGYKFIAFFYNFSLLWIFYPIEEIMPQWEAIFIGSVIGFMMALRVLYIREQQVEAYLKNGGNPKRLT